MQNLITNLSGMIKKDEGEEAKGVGWGLLISPSSNVLFKTSF